MSFGLVMALRHRELLQAGTAIGLYGPKWPAYLIITGKCFTAVIAVLKNRSGRVCRFACLSVGKLPVLLDYITRLCSMYLY